MIKIYYDFVGEGDYCLFKFYLLGFLVVSGSGKKVKGGNKFKSREISTSNIFMTSTLSNSTTKPYRKPELDLWNKYLKSFCISEKTLLKWMDGLIKSDDGYNMYSIRLLKELRIKIKDNLQ